MAISNKIKSISVEIIKLFSFGCNVTLTYDYILKKLSKKNFSEDEIRCAITYLLNNSSLFEEIEVGIYKYNGNVDVSDCEKSQNSRVIKAIASLEDTRGMIISIGEDINPITATDEDMQNVGKLKEVIQKLDECKKVLDTLK